MKLIGKKSVWSSLAENSSQSLTNTIPWGRLPINPELTSRIFRREKTWRKVAPKLDFLPSLSKCMPGWAEWMKRGYTLSLADIRSPVSCHTCPALLLLQNSWTSDPAASPFHGGLPISGLWLPASLHHSLPASKFEALLPLNDVTQVVPKSPCDAVLLFKQGWPYLLFHVWCPYTPLSIFTREVGCSIQLCVIPVKSEILKEMITKGSSSPEINECEETCPHSWTSANNDGKWLNSDYWFGLQYQVYYLSLRFWGLWLDSSVLWWNLTFNIISYLLVHSLVCCLSMRTFFSLVCVWEIFQRRDF